jgi:2-octaprenyl-6-methoxyphenol hydroxylase
VIRFDRKNQDTCQNSLPYGKVHYKERNMIKLFQKKNHQPYDAVIVGGGLAGLLLACALKQHNFSVCVVTKPVPLKTRPKDGRGFALSAATTDFLDEIGLWDKIKDLTTPIKDIHVTASQAFLHFDHKDGGGTRPMGAMIISDLLIDQVESFFMDHKIERFWDTPYDVKMTEDFGEIKTNSGLTLKASLLIGADGKQSYVRGWAGFKTIHKDYDQTAYVGVVKHPEKDHNHVAHEHFTPLGPLAFLPLEGHKSAMVWAVNNAQTPLDLTAAINDYFTDLGPLSIAGDSKAYPLSATMSRGMVKDRVVLVGDAAHSFHPVAGQGLNVSLKDAATLTKTMNQARALGLTLNDRGLLSAYERQRSAHGWAMFTMTHGLVKLYSNQNPVLKFARTHGLNTVNKIKPLRTQFMKQAMGKHSKMI